MSYSQPLSLSFHQVAALVGKILREASRPTCRPGFHPRDHLKIARALGLTVPPNLLACAPAVAPASAGSRGITYSIRPRPSILIGRMSSSRGPWRDRRPHHAGVTSSTLGGTTSQPRSLLSMATLNMAKSHVRSSTEAWQFSGTQSALSGSTRRLWFFAGVSSRSTSLCSTGFDARFPTFRRERHQPESRNPTRCRPMQVLLMRAAQCKAATVEKRPTR